MTAARAKKIVLLGMMSQMPVAGHAWVVLHYLEGFRRLGCDVYYVEAHGCTPRELMRSNQDDGWELAAGYIARTLGRIDMADRWAYHALQVGRCYGMDLDRLRALYRSADLLINLHGGTVPLPEHAATGRLVYLETDPVYAEVRLDEGDQQVIDLLAQHCAFFSWGLNHGGRDCGLPLSDRFRFRPSPPPVVTDFWESVTGVSVSNGSAASVAGISDPGHSAVFTTVGNWRQVHPVQFNGQVYHWSKHLEFEKFLDLPRLTGQRFELALGRFEEDDRLLLEAHGWRVRRALDVSGDLDQYQRYVAGSRGEFTVAKDQNVRLRSGWFSERSAQYLAAGRPVVTQDTGFGAFLPIGTGLFAFSTLDDAAEAVEAIAADHPRHSRAASGIAREFFNYDVVLKRMLTDVGL